MIRKIFKLGCFKYSTKWVCPNCGCELSYHGEGNMKCPQCGAWMRDE